MDAECSRDHERHSFAVSPLNHFAQRLLAGVSRVALLFFLVGSTQVRAENVSFKTNDDLILVGEFSKPLGADKFTLILLHGVGSGKYEWKSFAEYLSTRGFGTFAYDARGHGSSTKKGSGQTVDFQYFFGRGIQSDWGKMIPDCAAAVKFLKDKYGINPRLVGFVGASIGANLALRYAVDHKEVPFVILLSPGIDYQGITINDVLPKYGHRPLLAAASPTDGYAYQSVKSFQSILGQSKTKELPNLSVYTEPPGSGHGVQMFKRQNNQKVSQLEEKIMRWIENQKPVSPDSK